MRVYCGLQARPTSRKASETVNHPDLKENVHTKALVFMNIPPGQSDLALDKIRNEPRNQLSDTQPRVRPG